MIKPVVSMNQMSMNESIATTCCFKWDGVDVTGTAVVLHGGKLNVNYKYGYYYPGTDAPGMDPVKVSDGWLNVPCVPTGANNYMFVENAANLPFYSGGDWYLADKTPITENNGHIVREGWKFTDPAAFYTKYVKDTKIQHIGATSAHYTWVKGNEWLADHEAQQFAS